MTRASTRWLLAPFTLSLACGDTGGATDGATGGPGTMTITTASASETETTPTTSGGPTSASETTEGMSGASQSGSETGASSTGDATDPTGSTATGSTATGDPTSSTDDTTPDMTTGPLKPEPCQVEMTKINPIPPDVLLVLDKSGSMSMESWDHDEDPQTADVTRWYSLYGVVESIVTTFDKTVNFGVKLYPKIDAGSYVDEGACIVDPGVEVEISPMNAAGVLAKVPAADFEVLGGTPMETGLKEAFKYLQALDPSKQRFALLIADGEISKTCQGEIFNEALGAVKGGLAMGIPTYVVGIDVDPSTSAQLKYLAEAGGKPNANNPDSFYQTTSQTELQAALQQIVDDTLSCVIDVDPEPAEPALFEVWIGATEIAPADDCTKDDGWVWTKPHVQIELCGQACLDLKKSGQVEARYFCEAN